MGRFSTVPDRSSVPSGTLSGPKTLLRNKARWGATKRCTPVLGSV